MKISQLILDDFLEIYFQNSKYLLSAKDEEDIIKGNFSIERSTYLINDTGHLNLADLLICYNQLIYVGLASKIKRNYYEKLKEMDYDLFKKNQLNALAYKVKEINLRKIIYSKDFSGEINIRKVRKINNTYYVNTLFNFENSITGEINIAIKLNND